MYITGEEEIVITFLTCRTAIQKQLIVPLNKKKFILFRLDIRKSLPK